MEMVAQQKNLRIPTALIPRCPVCGGPMSMNLRSDATFVEDEHWHRAQDRYNTFLDKHKRAKILYLELGVGYNTPGIIKLPFWQMTYQNPNAVFATINAEVTDVPDEIKERSICIGEDITEVLL